jgi:hypothetical protein
MSVVNLSSNYAFFKVLNDWQFVRLKAHMGNRGPDAALYVF